MPEKRKGKDNLLTVAIINIHLPEAYPSLSHDDIRRDDGDPRHGKSFVSLSDNEGTQFHKKEDPNIDLEDL